MIKIQISKNIWLWFATVIWLGIVGFGRWLLGSLLYTVFLKTLALFGIQETTLLDGLLKFGIPLVVFAIGFYFIIVFIKKGQQFEHASQFVRPKIRGQLMTEKLSANAGIQNKNLKLNLGVKKFGWNFEIFIQIINDENYDLEIDEIGLLHGLQDKYEVYHFSMYENGKDFHNIRIKKVLAHSAPYLLIPINQFDWKKKTGKVTGAFVKLKNGNLLI
jgi:hypothetical protein